MTTLFTSPPQTAQFYVSGTPMPQGSKTPIVRNGRAVLLDGRRGPARAAFAEWRNNIERNAGLWLTATRAPKFQGPVRVKIVFRLERPASVTPRKRWWPAVAPDLDKLARAVLDGLKPIWTDDALVCELVTRKRYATEGEHPGAHITIEPLDIPEETHS